MINKHKIRIMTKLALYDKKYGYKDNKANEYFKWDYIYIKNFWTRISVFVGLGILAGFYLMHLLFVEQRDVIFMDYESIIKDLILKGLVIIVLFTVISGLLGYREYVAMMSRRKKYFELLDKLDGIKPKRGKSVQQKEGMRSVAKEQLNNRSGGK